MSNLATKWYAKSQWTIAFLYTCIITSLLLCVRQAIHWVQSKNLKSPNERLGLEPSASFPVTYLDPNAFPARARRAASIVTPQRRPDVTAVVLNWSRLTNVIKIADTLCQSSLDDVIAEVYIWNNSPEELSYHAFTNTTCSSRKLRIYNSPSNLYFQARFLACAQASSPYCFLQDDDYLILPEIIRTLRARVSESMSSAAIHLLPPHEHLSSRLRVVYTSQNGHTSFAWLGHGSVLRRSRATKFLSLLQYLNVSDEEMKMADNYFTILNNRIPETWFDQGIELTGGQPFTVGSEGNDRNKRHITRAAQYLDSLLTANISSSVSALRELPLVDLNFVDFNHMHPLAPLARAPCLGISCLLETNVQLLSEDTNNAGTSVKDMLSLEAQNLLLLDPGQKAHYLKHPPSFAVDGRSDTAFRSPNYGRAGEYVSLDFLSIVSLLDEGTPELAWLVPNEMEYILAASKFEYSMDAHRWTASSKEVSCTGTLLTVTDDFGAHARPLRECSVIVSGDNSTHSARFFRVRLEADVTVPWCIYEVWLR
ncbi:hypothetical protein BV22DRAFT_1015771 [Leucogyrophana mollusca]|uniref:Uncharacterized protein n=1 Tax=Leucogyrophana mollusca TaxID=85980 RepID=A0ACB8BC06_9AGAM|nr:hypothetical protein BV22DRAFT_1015771 [Leucogyrophana mollusca]